MYRLRNLKLQNLYLKKHKKNIMTVKEFHKKASELSQKAIVLLASGQEEEANFTYIEAFEYEKKAALVLLDKIEKEPSRSILFRSAAALALKAGLFRDSEQMAACGLAGNPPDNVLDELREIIETANFKRHLELSGEKIQANELMMSLVGEGVAQGMIKSSEFINRFVNLEKMIYRRFEFASGKEYRLNGHPSKSIKGLCQPYLSEAKTGSFCMKIRIGTDENLQMGLFEDPISVTAVVEEMIENIQLLNDKKEEELKLRIPNENYYQNFVSLAKEIAPDGSIVKQVGFTILRNGGEIAVGFKRPRNDFSYKGEDENIAGDSNKKTIEISGVLRMGDADKKTVRIKGIDQKSYIIKAPDGLSDIIKQYFDNNVLAIVEQNGEEYLLKDLSNLE